MNLGDLNKVWEVKPLKKPGEEDARCLLDRVAKQVQPIMHRHRWRVKLLSEFSPANPALLGLNVGGGAEVKLRLRRPNRDWDFFPFEQVLDTMLHELCHIEHGPHNAAFYQLWDELRKECDELMAKGITGTGQGFDAPGRRLGGFSHQPPLSNLRQTALAAAEKRARIGAIIPYGPRRLGGDGNIMSALSPIQAAAMAAERRIQDEVWCGSGCNGVLREVDIESSLSENSTTESGKYSKGPSVIERSKNPVIVDPHSSEKNKKRLHVDSLSDHTDSSPSSSRCGAYTSSSLSSHCAKDDMEDKSIWECSVCTLFNQAIALICEACGTAKPKDVASKFKMWSCKFCTLENSIKLDRCSACGQWRYSYGPPVATSGPNYGT